MEITPSKANDRRGKGVPASGNTTENNLYTQEEKRKIIENLLKIGHLSGSIKDWIKEDSVNTHTHGLKNKLSPFSSRPEDDQDSDDLAQREHARS